jgi:hypothetical protein
MEEGTRIRRVLGCGCVTSHGADGVEESPAPSVPVVEVPETQVKEIR